MIRTPRPLRWTSLTNLPATIPALPRRGAALLSLALLAGGCGAFVDQHVPEDFPSGARPAPVPEVHLAGADVNQAELPPAPPAEPAAEAAAEQPPGKAAAVATRLASGAAPGHLRLSGTYQADADAVVACAFLAGRGLQITLDSAAAPLVELDVSDFLGAGHYVATAKLITREGARAMQLPAGEAQIDIQVSEIDRPHVRSLLSGTFKGAYAGQGVQGQLAGTFDRCLYGGALP